MAQAQEVSLARSMFGRFAGGATVPASASTPSAESQAAPSTPPAELVRPPPLLGQVKVSLEGLPQVHTVLRVHSEQDLKLGVAQAFGFKSTADFDVFRLAGADTGLQSTFEVRVLSRTLLNEVAHIETLFTDVFDFEAEVVYSQLAKISGIPLLRLHRAIAPACGEAVASWLASYDAELKQVTSLRDRTLQDAAGGRIWRALKARIEAVFPGLVGQLPVALQTLPAADASAEERLESISSLFSRILDEVRLRVLPLRTLRTTASGTWDKRRLRPGTRRLLRVSFEGDAADAATPGVFIAALDAETASPSSASSSSAAGSVGGCEGESQVASGFTGHDLYYQVARFFRQTHVQVRTRDGTLVRLDNPHESLLGQLPGPGDGICVDLVASRYQPQVGSFDQLYREVLLILGPRHFKLDQSYRLQLPCNEEVLTTTQGNALITTVILIPINYMEGKQMYLFRSPRHRQCKAMLRTFDDFKEMLQTLVHVFEHLTTQMSPAQAERLRSACAEGAPGQTPLAPYEGRRVQRYSSAWQNIHGCKQAGRSAMGLLGGLQVGHGFPAPWRVPEEMLIDQEVLFAASAAQDALSECDTLWRFGALGGYCPGAHESMMPDTRRFFDMYGIDYMQVHDASAAQRWCLPHWWRSPRPPDSGDSFVTHRVDPWSIAVGGLVGLLFGLAEGVCGGAHEHSLPGAAHMRILEKMARRGFVGLGVSAVFHFLGRLLRQCFPSGRYAAFSRKSVPASQAVVFLGTAAWALTSRQKYVAPGFLRRLWLQDLNLAERQAAGIILSSGLACSFSLGGYVLGAQLLGGAYGGPAGAFAGSFMHVVVSIALAGLDWWHDRRRRKQMKAAALQTLGLPESADLGAEVFKPMLSTRYKVLARYLHPDKNDSGRCDTTKVFSQIRLAKEILEQELKDYHSCPRDRLRRLFEQMCALGGYRRDRYVSEHPSGLIMNILQDGPPPGEDNPATYGMIRSQSLELEPASPFRPDMTRSAPPARRPLFELSAGNRRARSLSGGSSRSGIDSLTTVESRSLPGSRASSLSTPARRAVSGGCDGVARGAQAEGPAQGPQPRMARPRTPRRSSASPSRAKAGGSRSTSRSKAKRASPKLGSGDPWVIVPGTAAVEGGEGATSALRQVPAVAGSAEVASADSEDTRGAEPLPEGLS